MKTNINSESRFAFFVKVIVYYVQFVEIILFTKFLYM